MRLLNSSPNAQSTPGFPISLVNTTIIFMAFLKGSLMSTVLVDTAAWIALVNTRDELHSQARQTMNELRQRKVALVTTVPDRLEFKL